MFNFIYVKCMPKNISVNLQLYINVTVAHKNLYFDFENMVHLFSTYPIYINPNQL